MAKSSKNRSLSKNQSQIQKQRQNTYLKVLLRTRAERKWNLPSSCLRTKRILRLLSNTYFNVTTDEDDHHGSITRLFYTNCLDQETGDEENVMIGQKGMWLSPHLKVMSFCPEISIEQKGQPLDALTPVNQGIQTSTPHAPQAYKKEKSNPIIGR